MKRVLRVLFLARHGETDWNREGRWQGHTDIALNDAGRGQARALAEVLRAHGVGRIHTSDLLRAKETAETVAGALGVGPPIVDPALRERSFGVFEGLTRLECEARHPAHWARYRADPRDVPPGAESQDALADRMHEAVLRAVAESPELERSAASPRVASAAGAGPSQGPVLIVSHGGSIRALLARATGTMPPPVENVAVFRAVATPEGLTEVTLLGTAPR